MTPHDKGVPKTSHHLKGQKVSSDERVPRSQEFLSIPPEFRSPPPVPEAFKKARGQGVQDSIARPKRRHHCYHAPNADCVKCEDAARREATEASKAKRIAEAQQEKEAKAAREEEQRIAKLEDQKRKERKKQERTESRMEKQ
ncbi:hypothetical protein S7711_10529 [Stachybotrys chartarum IBT 7711]|uniref:Uncharacterized protein n=1 Tax=Stachybotrys chartarum (strain CBS 109288 / IBT 7711) TaxID=1280523 RepID=A0A084AMY9_STACB|nr:hypothetical protein S7711_10529 [Stachybotrys chartarum IBT 7711]KFA48875.1 hypothetical protein S40293_10522 [Stachybotrys chartarum IBT 40293]